MKKRNLLLIILLVVVLFTLLFVKNKLFEGKLTCTGVITDHIDEWEYGSDCFIVIDSQYGGPWIVYESLEEINRRFRTNLDYGDRVWISYTTNGYEIAPQHMEIVYIRELRQ